MGVIKADFYCHSSLQTGGTSAMQGHTGKHGGQSGDEGRGENVAKSLSVVPAGKNGRGRLRIDQFE